MAETITYRSVSISIYPWRHPSGREYWRFKRSDGAQVTRSTLEAIKKEAKAYAQTVHRGTLSIEDLTADQLACVKRFLEVSPTLAMVDEFIAWKRRKHPDTILSDARADFLAAKDATAGHYHRRNLGRYLALLEPLAARQMASISPAELQATLPAGSPRTLANVAETWVTFWRWAARQERIPKDMADLPASLDLPPVVRSIPEIYSPEELATLFRHVRPSYVPWLACAAFAGIRTEESSPSKFSPKSPLDWADFHWDRLLIIVRPETSKTGRRRVVPILPALAAWLQPLAKTSGRLTPMVPPSASVGRGIPCETTRIGQAIGGWKRNALRHSFLTYRAALVGISQTAMEAGNSEAEARRSYVDAQGSDVAGRWFSVFPKCSPALNSHDSTS